MTVEKYVAVLVLVSSAISVFTGLLFGVKGHLRADPRMVEAGVFLCVVGFVLGIAAIFFAHQLGL